MSGYTVGTWAGLPNYECRHCPFATLDEAEMLSHCIARHAPKPLGGGVVLVADARGREVTAPVPAPAQVQPSADAPIAEEEADLLAQLITEAPKRRRKEV